MAAVDVRARHRAEFGGTECRGVEIVFADAGAESGDDAADFLVAEHLVVAGFFDVEDLALERQDGLVAAVAALLGGAAGRLALDDEDFAAGGIALLAIGQLARQAAGIHGRLAAGELASLARGFAGAGGIDAFAYDFARDGGVLVEVLADLLVDELLDLALDVAVELALGLAFELGLRQLHRNDGHQSFAHVVAGDGDFVFLLLEHAGGAGEAIDGARERRAKTGKMGAAIDGVDGVGKGKNIFGVAVVVLQRDIDFQVFALALHGNGRVVQDLLALVEVLDEFNDAAGKAEFDGFIGALVIQSDLQPFVQKGELAQALRQNVVAVDRLLENTGVGMESDFRARLARFAGDGEL